MCGIFGYIGNKKNAAEVVFEGLKSLEYRGYDSWGLVVRQENRNFSGEKHIGKIGNTKLNSQISTLNSSFALGHTRWATHGGVVDKNAHPHFDCSGQVALVHNGIVENYLQLKKTLSPNHKFHSETDTEVVVHLLEEHLKKEGPSKAMASVFKKLRGLNALVALVDDKLIAAKNGSPLVVGLGKGEVFIASDATALLPYTNQVIFVKDDQMVVLTQDSWEFFNLKTQKKEKAEIQTLKWKKQEATLGNFPHFMLKEIYEQPKVLQNISESYLEQTHALCKLISAARGTFLIGAGTAFHACLAGSYLFSKVAHEHINTIVASEFNYMEDFLHKGSLVIALSQSGETIDVIEPLKRAREKGAKIVAIVNVEGSTIWRMSDFKILLGAGPEMAVASTKAYIAKIAVLLLVSYGLAGRLDEARKMLNEAAQEVERILFEEGEKIKKISKELVSAEHIFTIGRGFSYQSALESAMKMKEVSYIHTEGLAGGELKHGPIALISKGTPCIVFAPEDESYEAIISNATEISARGGKIIGISPLNNPIFNEWIKVSNLGDATIIPNVIPSQLFGYFLAVEKGLDPDKPRNLAKSVTVK